MTPLAHPRASMALLVALAACPSLAISGPWVEHAEARARLVGTASDLGLEIELQPGWHVYWKNSGDAGYPPRLDFAATRGLAAAELRFPAPTRFELPAGLVSFGYERAVIYPIDARFDGRPPAEIRARLDYLVCREECVPLQAELALPRVWADTSSDPDASRLAAARAALPIARESSKEAPDVTLAVSADVSGQRILELRVGGGSWRAARPDLFFEVHPEFALGRPLLLAGRDGWRFRVPLEVRDLTRPLPEASRFDWTITGFERPQTAGVPASVALAGMTLVPIQP